jgi:hypothetical protein
MGDSPDNRWADGLRRALLPWYRRHARALPWREGRDAYRVWVSEIMLQQTQVATVQGYYERFPVALPHGARAGARPARPRARRLVGAGLLPRARHLHEAAGIVVREHAGRVPSEPGTFAALPGVGRYTVGAVLSIGFGAPLPVLDGNVARCSRGSRRGRGRSGARRMRRPSGPGRAAARSPLAGGLEPGADGAGRHRVHAARAAVRGLPGPARPAARPRRAGRRTFHPRRRAGPASACGAPWRWSSAGGACCW